MTDLFMAYRRADKERADIVRKELEALRVAIHPDTDPKARGAAKAIREAAAQAKAVLTLWPEALLDPAENHAGLMREARAAHESGRLVAARLDGFDQARLEAPFDAVPAPVLAGWLTAPGHPATDPEWAALLRAVGIAIGRPGLADLAAAAAADRGKPDEPAQRAFARRFPDDPAAAAIWSRFEAAERERFVAEFRKVHGILAERGNAAQERLRQTLESFAAYLKAVRAGETAERPDPKAALADGAAALRESVARLSADNERLRAALDKAQAEPPAAAAWTFRGIPLRWAGISAAAFLMGSVAAAGITEFAGPLRGDNHPRIAALSQLARERAEAASTSGAELARLREAARTAARRAETAEANLRVARTQLAHSQTELIQRQNQASEASSQLRRVQADLQAAQQAAQGAAQAAEQRVQEAINRANAAEQEARGLREAQAAAAQAAPAQSRDVTGSVPGARPQPAAPAGGGQLSAPPAEARSEVTGSIPPAVPTEGPYRHRRDRWSFTIQPGFRLESDNDLPGPVNSVLVHGANPDAVIVVSANSARHAGTCTPQAWYWENIVEGERQRRGMVTGDSALTSQAAGLHGFSVRGRGVLSGDRFRSDLDYYDIVVQHRGEPGIVYLIQARYPRAMASEMVRSVNEMWRSFRLEGPRPYPTRC